jgi:hypothetical protein
MLFLLFARRRKALGFRTWYGRLACSVLSLVILLAGGAGILGTA